jgi:hypothetical protein
MKLPLSLSITIRTLVGHVMVMVYAIQKSQSDILFVSEANIELNLIPKAVSNPIA